MYISASFVYFDFPINKKKLIDEQKKKKKKKIDYPLKHVGERNS